MNKQIILICSDEEEGSTDIVCQWLNYFSKQYIRFSCNDKIKIDKIIIENDHHDIEFTLKGNQLKMSQIKSYWYRRSKPEFIPFNESQIQNKILAEMMKVEYQKTIQYFLKSLNEKAKLNKYEDNSISKLFALNIAKKHGFKIPDTKVVTSKKHLSPNKEFVVKAIGDLFYKTENGFSYLSPILLNYESLKNDFFYSQFQNRINKKFELRIFYAFEKFYSTAIFSQQNEKTALDFRNYDYDFPNRVCRFELSEQIKIKLKRIMKDLDLKSGSIDLAYTKQNEFVFFEVNPVGQFEQVSFPGNYFIHKIIAEKL